jgi:hypothetical protein
MNALLVCLLMIGSVGEKAVEVRFTETAPKIDGVIEELWHSADSITDFVQHAPYDRTDPTERTTVYVLQDAENLYIAYRCFADHNRPVACLTSDEDYIIIGIDPFGSKSEAYFFTVYASGIPHDGWIYDDGRTMDYSWEGVWYRGVKVHDDYADYEVKIPFKSIRYKKELNEWGIQFHRYTAANRETAFWTEVPAHEDPMVSKYGTLKGISPRLSGYYFELYPEGFVRYDRYVEYGEDSLRTKKKLSGSLNLKWDATPQTMINATVYPDFAQIESDPYTLNLSRYPTYLSEQRPFFLEGIEIFRMSNLGEGRGFFDPLNIFYTRRIGKSLNGEVVPIIGGLKATHKTENWNFGLLGAYTDSLETEPERGFGVFRMKRKLLENSEVGVLFSGTAIDRDHYNYALGFDGVYRKGFNQLIVQTAASERSGKQGWAITSGYVGLVKGFLIMSSAEMVDDSFDVAEIGYVPWAGLKQFFFMAGPHRNYEQGFIRTLFYGPAITVFQEPGEDSTSILGGFSLNPNFRNNWGFNLEVHIGPVYQADTHYTHRGVDLDVWGSLAGQQLNFGGNYEYSYNYYRGYVANMVSGWYRVAYGIIDNAAVVLNGNEWVEWDPDNNLVSITSVLTPRTDIRFNADMMLSIFNQMVFATPGTEYGETNLVSNRLGALLAWNFKPKSWVYVALNDYNIEDANGQMELYDRVAAVKAKYLVYF